jgi:aldehyde dehydrogenase (NAD+)/aldehyde dehydrogenase
MLTNYSKFHAIQAGRVWVNQYNTYPAHAPFVGLKNQFGRENHKMALDHYRVVKTC